VEDSFGYDFIYEVKQGTGSRGGDMFSTDNVEHMPRLQTALQVKFICIICCDIDYNAAGADHNPSAGDAQTSSTKVEVPADKHARKKWLLDFSNECGTTVQHITLPQGSVTNAGNVGSETGSGKAAAPIRSAGSPDKPHKLSKQEPMQGQHQKQFIMSVPNDFLSSAVDGDNTDTRSGDSIITLHSVAVCAVHEAQYLGTEATNSQFTTIFGPVRDIEHKLELLMVPCASSEKAATSVSKFEHEVNSCCTAEHAVFCVSVLTVPITCR
jgi:hypothetical protein